MGSPTDDEGPTIPAHGRTDGNGNPEDDDLLQVLTILFYNIIESSFLGLLTNDS